MGAGSSSSVLHIIDFGLSTPYCNPHTGQHVTFSENNDLTGTARYASTNAHEGAQQTRRDDIESIAYILLYFAAGKLPWQGLGEEPGRRSSAVLRVKKTTDFYTFCKVCRLPREFADVVYYARSLKFEEAPNYEHIKKMYSKVFLIRQYESDHHWDWKTSFPVTQLSSKSLPHSALKLSKAASSHAH